MAALESIIKESGSGRMEFQANGARFTWSVRQGETFTPILGSFIRGDGSEGISHSCVPLFDTDPAGKLKRHGFTRDRDRAAKVVLQTLNSITTRDILSYGDPESQLLVIQTYAVTDKSFELITDLRNIGDDPIPELSGLHPYINAPWGRANVLLNGQSIARVMEEDELVDAKPFNTLLVPGLLPESGALNIEQYGLPIANAWVGQNSDGVFDNNYFALSFTSHFRNSSTNFRSEQQILDVGEAKHYRLTFSIAA